MADSSINQRPEMILRSLYIFKTGSTHPDIKQSMGDFEEWIMHQLGSTDRPLVVLDISAGDPIPDVTACAGVILTGSPAMVTDKQPWSVALEQWLPTAVEASVPVLGICYGHQLLAESLGGTVADHPKGKEIGTVSIRSTPAAQTDPLFAGMPETFVAHVTHLQSALRLPTDAVLLAGNQFEPHQAFRMGSCAWGVQFHPEFDDTVMRAYIEHQKQTLEDMGLQPATLLEGIVDTPQAKAILPNFLRYVCQRQSEHFQAF